MGLFNRRLDIEVERLKYEDAERQRGHELAMRDKDAAIMAQEWAARTQVAQLEGEAKSEQEGYRAMAASYGFAQPEPGGKMAAFSSFVRPWISLGYWLITSAGSAWIIYYAFAVVRVEFSVEQWHELVMYVIAWIAFMAGATIGWWYAMRPGKAPPTINLGR
jgi:hypothetical protein